MPTKQTVPLESSRAAATVIISSFVQSSDPAITFFSAMEVLKK